MTERAGKPVVLVAGASRKQAHACLAADLYTSSLFRKARAFAEREGAGWFILSAEHGLLAPEAITEPYDRTLGGSGKRARSAWALSVFARICAEVTMATPLLVLAGRAYREPLVSYLEAEGYRVEVPMAGLGIGQQLAWLSVRR